MLSITLDTSPASPTSSYKSTSRCANSETTTQSILTTPYINHDHAIPPRGSNMSWFIRTIKSAGAVAVGAGAGGLFWLGSPATPYSISTDPVASHALSAIAATFPSTLYSTVTSAPIIAFSLSTAIPNINGSHVVDWSSFINSSDFANSSFTSFGPILATAAPSGSPYLGRLLQRRILPPSQLHLTERLSSTLPSPQCFKLDGTPRQ